MQLDEELELAFRAGVEWALGNSYCRGLGGFSDDYVELDRKIVDGYIEYINGNLQSTESTAVLDKGSS